VPRPARTREQSGWRRARKTQASGVGRRASGAWPQEVDSALREGEKHRAARSSGQAASARRRAAAQRGKAFRASARIKTEMLNVCRSMGSTACQRRHEAGGWWEARRAGNGAGRRKSRQIVAPIAAVLHTAREAAAKRKVAGTRVGAEGVRKSTHDGGAPAGGAGGQRRGRGRGAPRLGESQ
jgi:hypothetical protein